MEIVIIISLIIFILFREVCYSINTNQLLNRIMSRDYAQYTVISKKTTEQPKQPEIKYETSAF